MPMINSIKMLRKSRGLTQQEISDYIGISIRNYREKESGYLQFSQEEIAKLITLFSLNGDEVLFYFFNQIAV